MNPFTSNRQLLYLFLCNLAIVFIGMGLFPILPLYAAKFGAARAEVGLYLAGTYGAIASGTMLAGRLAEKLGPHRVFVGAGLLGLPAVVLLGQTTAFWQVVVLTATVWFSGGIGLTLVSIFTGLIADGRSRGRSFSLTSLATPIGALIGGTVVSQLVAGFGYPTMFAGLGLVWSVWPVIALVAVKVPAHLRRPMAGASNRRASPMVTPWAFYALCLTQLLAAMAVGVARLGTSLSMQTLGFPAAAVASTSVAGGLVTIPVAFLFGSLSDRLGRRRFLMAGYGLAASAALVLTTATQLWHFWLAATLTMVAQNTNNAMTSAFATDMLASEQLSRRLPWLQATNWMAGVLAFAGSGLVLDAVGAAPLFLGAAGLALAAMLQLGWLTARPSVPVGTAVVEAGRH